MSSQKARATYVVAWEQTQIDGFDNAPVESLNIGSAWRWHGDATRVDTNCDALVLHDNTTAVADRLNAASRLNKILGKPGALMLYGAATGEEARAFESGFELTDGQNLYRAAVLFQPASGKAPLVLFHDRLPAKNRDLWVVNLALNAARTMNAENKPATLCFVPGTMIATETGAVAVEDLCVGHRVLTRDNGAQPLRWIGRRNITGARLHAMPWLRPVRIRQGVLGLDEPDRDLLLSPDHRVLISDRVASDVFGDNEVLVAAKDMVGNDGVTIDKSLRKLTYIHLLFDAHQIIWANQVACESFHPEGADLGGLAEDQMAELAAVLPDALAHPEHYGDFARRPVETAEAALLKYAAIQGRSPART